MRLQDRVGQELAVAGYAHVGKTLELVLHVVGGGVPYGHFQTVGHALGRLDEETRAAAGLKRRRAQRGESRGLKPIALEGLQGNLEQQPTGVVERFQIYRHDHSLFGSRRYRSRLAVRCVIGKARAAAHSRAVSTEAALARTVEQTPAARRRREARPKAVAASPAARRRTSAGSAPTSSSNPERVLRGHGSVHSRIASQASSGQPDEWSGSMGVYRSAQAVRSSAMRARARVNERSRSTPPSSSVVRSATLADACGAAMSGRRRPSRCDASTCPNAVLPPEPRRRSVNAAAPGSGVPVSREQPIEAFVRLVPEWCSHVAVANNVKLCVEIFWPISQKRGHRHRNLAPQSVAHQFTLRS